jgi:hypothetical protein
VRRRNGREDKETEELEESNFGVEKIISISFWGEILINNDDDVAFGLKVKWEKLLKFF